MSKLQNKLFGQTIFDKRIYVFACAVLLLLMFDFLAIHFSLYFFYEWIDIPVHVTGGCILGFLLYYLVYANPTTCLFFNSPRTKHHIFSTMIFWVLVIAISWEIAEFLFGRTVLSPKLPLDTFLDIVSTVGGALVAYLVIREWRIKKL